MSWPRIILDGIAMSAVFNAVVLVGFTLWPQEYSVMFPKKIKDAAAPYVNKAEARILSSLKKTDLYDFIILTVRENQLFQALEELKYNESPTIVTMVNPLDTYDKWEAVCGEGRILPAFPGAGGGFDGEVPDAALTPRFIQPATIGKTDGRERIFAALLMSAMIPVQIVEDMHTWQLCHK